MNWCAIGYMAFLQKSFKNPDLYHNIFIKETPGLNITKVRTLNANESR